MLWPARIPIDDWVERAAIQKASEAWRDLVCVCVLKLQHNNSSCPDFYKEEKHFLSENVFKRCFGRLVTHMVLASFGSHDQFPASSGLDFLDMRGRSNPLYFCEIEQLQNIPKDNLLKVQQNSDHGCLLLLLRAGYSSRPVRNFLPIKCFYPANCLSIIHLS